MAQFNRVFRFEDSDMETHYADYPTSSTSILDLVGLQMKTRLWPTKAVAKILSPIPKAADNYRVGLNYKGHAAEAKVSFRKA